MPETRVSIAANIAAQNMRRGLNFYDAVTKAHQETGEPWGNIQIEMTRRSAEARRERALKSATSQFKLNL